MYNRIFDIDSRLDEGMFLFGARQVGKSTLLKEKFKDAVYFDLLDSDLRSHANDKFADSFPRHSWLLLQPSPIRKATLAEFAKIARKDVGPYFRSWPLRVVARFLGVMNWTQT